MGVVISKGDVPSSKEVAGVPTDECKEVAYRWDSLANEALGPQNARTCLVDPARTDKIMAPNFIFRQTDVDGVMSASTPNQ
jgi:hypothetical protein